MRFLAPLSLFLVLGACCGKPPKHILPIGDKDPEVVFETQLITAYPDPRRNPPVKKQKLAKKEPKEFK